MSYDNIRIARNRGKFEVRCTDPEIAKRNRERDKSDTPGEWTDPEVEYNFDTKEQVVAFVTKAIDIALPVDEYTSAFDKLAVEAQKS